MAVIKKRESKGDRPATTRPLLLIEFLEAAKAFMEDCLSPPNEDQPRSIYGEFSTRTVLFTRELTYHQTIPLAKRRRTFKPVIITFAGKEHFVPDITRRQYLDAVGKHPRKRPALSSWSS